MEASAGLRQYSNSIVSASFRLLTLGTLTLVDQHGVGEPTLGRRRRKLAVLTVLALARHPVGRDRLAEMFWGDEEDSRARHSLADSLSNLRRVLGSESVATRQFEIALLPNCPLTIDALDVMDAYERRDFGRVVELYRGPFLDGLAVPGSASFERWVGRVRDQLHRQWVDACSRHCLALARARRWDECAVISRRWLDAEPLSSDAALYLINAIKASATTTSYVAALAEYGRIEQRLARDFQRTPADEVVQLAASIREQPGCAQVHSVRLDGLDTSASPASAPARVDQPERASRPARGRRLATSRVASLAVVALLFVTATSFTSPHADSAKGRRPVVAVSDVRAADRDSAILWLEHSVPRLVASQVARVPGIDVVAPDFVREARHALGVPDDRDLSASEMDRLGRRVGARWVAVGQVRRSDTDYVLDFIVRDVDAGVSKQLVRLSHADLIALSDQAAAALADFASASGRR